MWVGLEMGGMAWEARHVLLGRARVKARSLAERAIGNPFGKLHREVGSELCIEVPHVSLAES